jgi:hypothetical protein
MKMEVFNNCGVNLGTPDKTIKDAIYNMSETYFTQDNLPSLNRHKTRTAY